MRRSRNDLRTDFDVDPRFGSGLHLIDRIFQHKINPTCFNILHKKKTINTTANNSTSGTLLDINEEQQLGHVKNTSETSLPDHTGVPEDNLWFTVPDELSKSESDCLEHNFPSCVGTTTRLVEQSAFDISSPSCSAFEQQPSSTSRQVPSFCADPNENYIAAGAQSTTASTHDRYHQSTTGPR
ncbi:unnamed protein product, partial [Amoebophrya sp. A120]|eukprot:GSA120T00019297001.1